MRSAVCTVIGVFAASSVLVMWSSSASADDIIGPSGRLCFAVAGSPGDAAVVNLTPVLAQGSGDGLLISSDVASPPAASNVNYSSGSVDPNVAIVPIGSDGKVCYVNSTHTNVHLVADHLGTISASVYRTATSSGVPNRVADTRPPTPAPTTSTQPTTTTQPPSNCDSSYPTVCIPPPPPDLDCGDVPYQNFTVLQPDPHNFDGNNDGIGCAT